MLLTPSNTPEFSPIENMFGYVKRTIQDMEFSSNETVAKKVATVIFNLTELTVSGFF